MRTLARTLLVAAVAGAVACAPAPGRVAPGSKPSTRATTPVLPTATAPATRIVPPATAQAPAVTLTGQVRIISDNGGGLIGNNGAAIISNNGGRLISDGGGALVSNNGAAYRAAGRHVLAAPAPAAEARLADAVVTLHDARGSQLVDERGAPLTATTDRTGAYRLTAALPAENVVVRVKLWTGGQLAAIATRDREAAAPVDLDTASSIGTSYVLREYVKGDQRVLDKLPAREAARLKAGLDEARRHLTAVPRYEEAELAALGQTLRGREPAVDRALEDIRALLIGQANLGAGRPADTVPLLAPNGLAVGPDGTVYVGEPGFGRLRMIGPDGLMGTLADVTRGKARRNFKDVVGLATGPDGSVYVLTWGDRRVWRIFPDGRVEAVFGNGKAGLQAPGGPADQIAYTGRCIAVGPDGTLYVGGAAWDAGGPGIIAVGPDGRTREFARGQLVGGAIEVLAVRGDALYYFEDRGPDAVYTVRMARRAADGTETVISTQGQMLAVAPDGSAYIGSPWSNSVAVLEPGGGARTVAGPGGVPGSEGLDHPHQLACGPDGTLYVLATGNGLVHALSPDHKTWRTVAGTTTFDLPAGQPGDIPLNGPAGVAFDRQGRMIVAESGTSTLKRLDGAAFTRFAGGVPWSTAVIDFANQGPAAGEGLPALAASFEKPRGLVAVGDEYVVVDQGNSRIRTLRADGTVRTRVGQPGGAFYQDPTYPQDHPYFPNHRLRRDLPPDVALAPEDFLTNGATVTAGSDGSVYFTTGQEQIARQRPDGRVVLVAGAHNLHGRESSGVYTDVTPGAPARERSLASPSGMAFGPDGALYVAEAMGLRILKVLDPAGANPTLAPVAGLSLPRILMLGLDATNDGEGVPAEEAVVCAPVALCFGPDGTLYYSELGGSSAAVITSLFPAGLPMPDGVRPTFPRVRKIGRDGRVTTVAGPGSRFFADPAAEDALVLPTTLAIDPQGRLVIVDQGANMIRILPAGSY